jgi:hypothetical protein
MIGNIYTEAARANWTTVPGRKVNGVYDEKGNPTKLSFSENNTVVYAQYFTYDENGNATTIECKSE